MSSSVAKRRNLTHMCLTDGRYPLGILSFTKTKEACMKLKLFSVQSGNRKTQFDALETNVNQWLADHPNILIENTNDLSQPNINWSHLALAVWYTEK